VKQIRFAVGEPGDQLSPVWRIWNEKNEVYLTAKFMGGAFKVSMHASGVWTVAATSESRIELSPGNRRMKTWRRPPEFQPGWTWGPHIGVPRMPDTDHAKIDEGQTKPIEWPPKPEPGVRATITIYFAAAKKTPQDTAEISTTDGAFLNDYLALKNKQRFSSGSDTNRSPTPITT